MGVGHFRGTGGVVHEMDLPLPEVYADQLRRGDLVRVNADGSPYDEAAESKPEPDAPVSRPAKSASKAAWVAWAVAEGADRAEAEKATKDDLIAAYGQDAPDPDSEGDGGPDGGEGA